MLERACDLAQRNVRCDKRERNFSACQTHREILGVRHNARQKIPFARNLKPTSYIRALVNGTGYDCIELTAQRKCDRFLQCRRGSARTFGGRISWPGTGISTDDFTFNGARNAIGVQSEIDNFRADSCAISQRDADAWMHRAASSAPRRLASNC